MTEEVESHAQRAANLARIRDNQRRSRARRKEYLQELETKYHNCEQVGIEASAEIQAAARRVVDENKRLRHILKQRGLSDAEIDAIVSDTPENGQTPTAAANALEGLLGQRRPCCPGSDCGNTSSERTMSSTPPVTTAPKRSPSPVAQSAQQITMTPQVGASNPLFSSPHITIPANTAFPIPQPAPYPAPVPMLQPTMDYGVGYDEAFAWQNQYQMPQPSDVGDSSSCLVAADAIRSIKPELGYELEQELGCSTGQECRIPNQRIFNIMDRYTADAPI